MWEYFNFPETWCSLLLEFLENSWNFVIVSTMLKRRQDNAHIEVPFHHHPSLITAYPRKQGWPDLPHFDSNLSNSPLHLAQFMASFFSKLTL